jgi:integrase
MAQLWAIPRSTYTGPPATIADMRRIGLSAVIIECAALYCVKTLADFWGSRSLAEVTGKRCRDYVAARSSAAAARRELEDLRSAINHHRREGLCTEIISVVLPQPGAPRQRWLTRNEAARLIWAAWCYREVQKGKETGRRSRRHIARFILVGLYTGTRASPICGAAFEAGPGHGFLDLDRGVFYHKPAGERETKKRQPPARIPV